MGVGFLNPLASGQSTGAMQMLMAQAYGRKGGRKSASRRRKRKSAAAGGGTSRRRRAGTRKARKVKGPKFGSPAYRKKYLKK